MDKDTLEIIEKEWQGMPEFVQEDLEAKISIMVHFLSIEDLEEFSRVTGLKVTPKTKGIFYPPPPPMTQKVYVDEP